MVLVALVVLSADYKKWSASQPVGKETDPMPIPRDARPPAFAGHVGRRVHSAERIVQKWTTTYPPLPRAVRKRLADQLLQEDPADPTEANQ
jgi:hypothetical protein